MEQCDTSLAAYLNNRPAVAPAAAAAPLTSYPPLSWQLVINLAKQAAAALTELHRRPLGILHTDVRAANMVLVTAGSNQQTTSSKVGVQQQLTLKICDYGLAEFVGSKEEAAVQSVTNPLWLPPEIDVNSATKRVNKKTDVFGLGELATKVSKVSKRPLIVGRTWPLASSHLTSMLWFINVQASATRARPLPQHSLCLRVHEPLSFL